MIHRVVFGSIERFIGVITEHFAGAFPTWLSPVQVEILPITDRARDFGESILTRLDELGVRAEIDNRNEKVGYKLREHKLQKIPYLLVIGDKEVESGDITVNTYKKGDIGTMKLDDFISMITEEIKTRKSHD